MSWRNALWTGVRFPSSPPNRSNNEYVEIFVFILIKICYNLNKDLLIRNIKTKKGGFQYGKQEIRNINVSNRRWINKN